jgi:flagellar hook-associated protein 2
MTEAISSSGGAIGVPINVTGLASGLNTNEIINALMGVERKPVVQMTNEQTKLQAQQKQLQSLQSSLQQLAFSAADLASPSLFQTAQTVNSSNATQVSATTSSGAGVGGYQVNVTQLANSAQRTFSFTSPTAEETLEIDGNKVSVKAGATIQEVAASINSGENATVYAAALNNGTLVLSDRTTGDTGTGFIQVSGGGVLAEQAALAKEGKNAEYTVDGVAGTSTSNTVTEGIAGVTLSLNALTTTTGPVTINVGAPGASVSAITSQVQSFVALYNSTVASIHTQLTTKPPTNPQSASEFGTGTLFGDTDLSGFLDSMRQAIYTPVAGLPESMSSLANIGVTTGAPTGGTYSQSSVEGQLSVNTTELASAIQTNPAGVQKMLASWSESFQNAVNVEAQPGGTLETRSNSDSTQNLQLASRITTMNEMLAIRQEALQAQYAELEAVMSQNQAQSSWLSSQTTAMLANDA